MTKTYTHLSLQERESIEIHLWKWQKQKDIAQVLRRSESCISKEIKKWSVQKRGTHEKVYLAKEAHLKAYQRRWRSKTQSMKINLNSQMKQFIIKEIQRSDIENSPKSIAAAWNAQQIDKKNHISHTSIYAWLETWGWNKFKQYLLYKYKWYKKKSNKEKKSKILLRVWIEQRPEAVNQRNQQWHFEADLIVSKKWHKAALLTLIDRKTRLPRIWKLKDKSSSSIMEKIAQVKNEIGIQSVTFDNGMEFAKHYKLNDIWIQTYFSDPYSPWQKGSIENLNRMVRRFFPKGTIFDDIHPEKIKEVCDILTHTPREILGYLSPYQVHFSQK